MYRGRTPRSGGTINQEFSRRELALEPIRSPLGISSKPSEVSWIGERAGYLTLQIAVKTESRENT